ncbi:hypothetical protein TURU_060644 [Turdus rufiventris]|nr:hypothetical protein TURU_060644 [Turdus rufiventris]
MREPGSSEGTSPCRGPVAATIMRVAQPSSAPHPGHMTPEPQPHDPHASHVVLAPVPRKGRNRMMPFPIWRLTGDSPDLPNMAAKKAGQQGLCFI